MLAARRSYGAPVTRLTLPGITAYVTYLTTPARGAHTHRVEVWRTATGRLVGLESLSTPTLVALSRAIRAHIPAPTVRP